METRTAQAFLSNYAPRLRVYNNSLLTPVIHPAPPTGPISRTTKRGTTLINYAEDGYDYDDEDEEDSRRRPTGLRSLRREDSTSRIDPSDKYGKEINAPVQVQGIWRDWMLKHKTHSDINNQAQAVLPLTLIPIRIDVDIPAFSPAAPYPLFPRGMTQAPPHMDPALYKTGDLTVPYKLRDIFLWNLHETMITTEQFAQTLVQDLDLPWGTGHLVAEISRQIRAQLAEYAGVALHPLFHSDEKAPTNPNSLAHQSSFRDTPATPATPLPSSTRAPETPFRNGLDSGFDTPQGPHLKVPDITATATPIPAASDDLDPDDAYRCVITLNVNLSSQLYTDKFEWSLLHPQGTAEAFAKLTCADLGLAGEWIPAMTHAIYEAVLRLKKEACEAGGLVAGWGAMGTEFPNDAAHGADAGWRYDPEHLAEEWEPKVEVLSKEEIEKREIDRERQIRRLRRETARFSSNTGMIGGVPGLGVEIEEERMGRGERSKKKRRFRSLSPHGSLGPSARLGSPDGRNTPDAGYGGVGGGALGEQEKLNWRCFHCRIWGTSVWAVRDGPWGPRSLCNNCGRLYEQTKKLPRWTKNLHATSSRPY